MSLQLGLRVLELFAQIFQLVAALAALFSSLLELAAAFFTRITIGAEMPFEGRNLAPEVDCVSDSPEEENDEDRLELAHGILSLGDGLV
jgi:hypothetical protein